MRPGVLTGLFGHTEVLPEIFGLYGLLARFLSNLYIPQLVFSG
jgi:hypothetical protein